MLINLLDQQATGLSDPVRVIGNFWKHGRRQQCLAIWLA
jgi:hypothetical protein